MLQKFITRVKKARKPNRMNIDHLPENIRNEVIAAYEAQTYTDIR